MDSYKKKIDNYHVRHFLLSFFFRYQNLNVNFQNFRRSIQKKNSRMWGHCTVKCAPYSLSFKMHSAASTYVFLGFKHWLIYIDCFCTTHSRHERWCIEKLVDQTYDIEHQLQYLQRGTINITCSSYYAHMVFARTIEFDKQYILSDIFNYVLLNESPDYHFLLDNCKLFKKRIWDHMLNYTKPVNFK